MVYATLADDTTARLVYGFENGGDAFENWGVGYNLNILNRLRPVGGRHHGPPALARHLLQI